MEGAEPRNRPYQTALTGNPGTGTNFAVGDGNAWAQGDYAEGPLGELSIVVSPPPGNNLTMRRTVGITPVETLASGDMLRKNPRFTIDQINVETLASIRALRGNGIYELATESVTYTTQGWYDMTATTAERVVTAWYIDANGDFRSPQFALKTDPENSQPKVWLGTAGFAGTVEVQYRKPYAVVTDLADNVGDIVAYEVIYKLMGIANVGSTMDPGRRTDRTVQGGQEGRDSIWYLREFIRLRDLEVARLKVLERQAPSNRISRRAGRFSA